MNQVENKSVFLSRLNTFLVVAIVASAITHFLVINDLSTKGFVFKDLKSKVGDLSNDKQSMESAISSLGSYQNLNPRIQEMKMVNADGANYINWDQNLVAKK